MQIKTSLLISSHNKTYIATERKYQKLLSTSPFHDLYFNLPNDIIFAKKQGCSDVSGL